MSSDHLVGGALSLGILALGALARWISSATRREGASDVTIPALAASLARMETKLDQLAASIGEMREARARLEAEHGSAVERITSNSERINALDARLSLIDDRITRVDGAHTEARHSLRAELHALLKGPPADAPRAARRGR